MSNYDHIHRAAQAHRDGIISQQQYDHIVSRTEWYLVSVDNIIVFIAGGALGDLAQTQARRLGGIVHYVCSYGNPYNCGGLI